MSAKDTILQNIRANKPSEEVPLPEIDFEPMTFDDLTKQLGEMVQVAGGQLVLLNDKKDVAAKLKELYPDSSRVVCNVLDCNLSGDNGSSAERPHEFDTVELAVIQGEFAVAENGAVWVKAPSNSHRALYFLAENIVLIVDRTQIVETMHQAYKRIHFDEPGYGVFISGPSKTADIEQSLVIGAHGPKSGFVFLV